MPFTDSPAATTPLTSATPTLTSIVCPSKTVSPLAGDRILTIGTRVCEAAVLDCTTRLVAAPGSLCESAPERFCTTTNGLTASPTNTEGSVTSLRLLAFSTENGAVTASPTNTEGSVTL